ncbi:MAG: energy transducer TonB [Sterolibacterium sp.]
MSYVQPHDSGRKLTGLLAVVLLHALLLYGLVNGLSRKLVQVVSEPLEARIIEEPIVVPDKPPPPPHKVIAPPPPSMPLPAVQIPQPASVPQNTITTVASASPVEAPAAPAPPAARHVTRSAAIVNASACEKPEYPLAALRAQEEGRVTLAFLIDADGKVLESKVEKSTATRRLDEAARKALGLCKFQPALIDGKPEKSWARIEYEWRIE